MIKAENKSLVVPGEELVSGMDFIPSSGTFREKEGIYASQLGILEVSGRLVKVIPLNGRYQPKVGDIVIGRIVNVIYNGWIVDIGYAYEVNLPIKGVSEFVERGANLARYYDIGDIVMTKVVTVSKAGTDVTTKGPGLRKLKGGMLINVAPPKVPRIIGKQGSMINMVKEKTDCRISVGQNGWVWIQCDDPKKELLAAGAIIEIEKHAHLSGLTERMARFLEEKK